MAEAPRQTLSHADNAWLRLEQPDNLMTIAGVMTCRKPVDFLLLKELLEDKLMRHERFRQQIVESRLPFGRPSWREGEEFALSHHLHRVEAPAPADQQALEALVGDLLSSPLDHSQPLWQVHFLEDYDGGSAIVYRVHHAVGDGLSLIRILLEMAAGAEPADTPLHDSMESLIRTAEVLELAETSGFGARILTRLITTRSDPDSVFRGKLGVEKRVAWSDPVPLARIERVTKRLGATIHDGLLSSLAGALGFYLKQQGAETQGLGLRAVTPINLRPPEAPVLGNRFGMIFVDLPVGVDDPEARLAEVAESLARLRESPESVVLFGALPAPGMTTSELEERALRLLGKKATAVVTHVAGPRGPIHLCGREVYDLLHWVPMAGALGLGLSLVSYNKRVQLGVTTDAGLVPDPQTIVTGFEQSLDEFASLKI
ncbi:MAG: wax ester/triacylglycerol synthase family O-acyltransferase [Thermoanaerobaculia bacterium]